MSSVSPPKVQPLRKTWRNMYFAHRLSVMCVVLLARSQTEITSFFFFFFPCLSAGCADTVAAAQTADSCISPASSICYLETSDFITADQCSCTPWPSPALSVLSPRLHVNDRLRLHLIKIWQALSIIRSIVSLCFFLPPSPLITKSIVNPPTWCPHPSSLWTPHHTGTNLSAPIIRQ